MKYWRGYLVAAIVAFFTSALTAFAAAHSGLLDMVYPYIDRIIMDYLAAWSADFAGCLWQTLYTFLIVLVIASGVLMLALRWNPIQWFGWVLAVFSFLPLLNLGVYGLNNYAGSIAEDIRMEVPADSEYSVSVVERAATYYRDLANKYAHQVSRGSNGEVSFSSFDKQAVTAAEGFTYLGDQRMYAIFTGTTIPVKQLGWSGQYDGVTGVTVGITGESAVNPNVPAVGMPFAICHEMSHRMCIANDSDANFAAFLACTSNTSPEFLYSGYLMAYRSCCNVLAANGSDAAIAALSRLTGGADKVLAQDIERYDAFFGEDGEDADEQFCILLVSWHIQEVASVEDQVDEEVTFDPMDESDDRFQDIINPTGSSQE